MISLAILVALALLSVTGCQSLGNFFTAHEYRGASVGLDYGLTQGKSLPQPGFIPPPFAAGGDISHAIYVRTSFRFEYVPQEAEAKP